MLERIASNETAFVVALLVWAPICVWVLSLIGWMITGEIEVLLGLAGITVGLALGFLTVNPPDPRLAPVFFSTVVLTLFLFVPVRHLLNRRALRKIDVELVEDQYAILRRRPNFGTEVKIARAVYELGSQPHAIGILQTILEQQPQALFDEERRMLRQWIANTKPDQLRQTIVCVECGMSVAPGPIYCPCCHAPYLLDLLKGKLLGGRLAVKLIVIWIAAVVGIAGMPTAATLLPPKVATPVMAGLGAVVLASLILAFKPQRRSLS